MKSSDERVEPMSSNAQTARDCQYGAYVRLNARGEFTVENIFEAV